MQTWHHVNMTSCKHDKLLWHDVITWQTFMTWWSHEVFDITSRRLDVMIRDVMMSRHDMSWWSHVFWYHEILMLCHDFMFWWNLEYLIIMKRWDSWNVDIMKHVSWCHDVMSWWHHVKMTKFHDMIKVTKFSTSLHDMMSWFVMSWCHDMTCHDEIMFWYYDV